MPLLVYMTAASLEEAQRIARHVVEHRLAAGVNILPSVFSLYHWQGVVEETTETVCIFKTVEDRFEALRKAIVSLHSYDTPCVVALPISAGHEDFLRWLHVETRAQKSD